MTDLVPGQEPNAEDNPAPKVEDKAPDPWEKFPAEFNWVRKELEEARKGEAAKRVEAKELKEKLAAAKTPEDVDKIIKDSEARVADAELKLARTLAARAAKLPEKLDGFITGTTPEEIESQVKTLAEFHPTKDDDDEPIITPSRPRAVNAASGDDGRDGHSEYEKWKANNRR